MSELGVLFKRKREAMGLKVSALAVLCGYKNISNGSQKIHDLEKHGSVHTDLLRKLAAILGISEAEYMPPMLADEQERLRAWAAWANEPVKPYGVLHLMPGMYGPLELPPGVTQKEAEAFVAEKARETKNRCCLVWSRRVSIFFASDGSVECVREATPTEGVAPRQIKP